MNNWIFIISVIMVLSILILINFESLYNYSVYTVAMKNPVLEFHVSDFHYYPVDEKNDYFGAVKNITFLDDDSISIDFAPNPNIKFFDTVPYFTHSENIQKDQTFAVACVNHVKDGTAKDFPDLKHTGMPSVEILKYLGIDMHGGTQVYKFYHITASLANEMPCNYPQIIEHSIDVVSVDIPDRFEEEFQ